MVRGLAWTSASKAAEQGISWVVTIMMARLLAPSDYGIMALAMIVLQFTTYLTEFSIGGALVQRDDADEEYLSTTFWFSLVAGLAGYAISFNASDLIASFFATPALAPVIRFLGLTFIAAMLATVPRALIERGLRFEKKAMADAAGNLTNGAVAISCAYAGLGVWSLVYAAVAKGTVSLIVLAISARWVPRLMWNQKKLNTLFRFGIPVTLSKFLSYFYYNVDTLIVGKFLGDKILGFYSMAFLLATMPVEKVANIVNQVNFPVFARLQGDVKETQRHFLDTTTWLAMVVFPLVAGLAITADVAIPAIIGAKWAPSVPLLQCLAILGLFRALAVVIQPMLMGRGNATASFQTSALSAAAVAVGCLVGVRWGVQGVAWAWAVVYPPVFAYMLFVALKELQLSFADYVRGLRPVFLAAAVMVACVAGVRYATGWTGILGLASMVLVGAASYLGVLFAAEPRVGRVFAKISGRFSQARKPALEV
jgi:teichuronic acid exporter